MGRNIAIFCDGTGNQFGGRNSNVLKLYAAACRDEVRQLCFYDPGVGTFGLSEALFEWQKVPAKVLGLAFGWGITRNIEQAYGFLMRHYAPGDRVYLFGFSRGAYTARALAGMIRAVGLVHPQHENLIGYATRLYRNVPEADGAAAEEFFELQARFRSQFSRDCPIRFMGLWDTVKSVGWFWTPVKWPYTTSNPAVAIVRQAVSLDERRCFFRQNLWQPSDGQDVKQVWFAGVHSDVGGGYRESESSLAKVPLAWMAREAQAHGFEIEPAELARILGQVPGAGDYVAPSPLGEIHRSLRGPWWLAEMLPRRFEDPRQAFRPVWRWPLLQWRELNKPRFVRTEASMLHCSVNERLAAGVGYAPPNLPAGLPVEY